MRRNSWLVVGCVVLAWAAGAKEGHGEGNRRIIDPSAKQRAALARQKYEEWFTATAEGLAEPPTDRAFEPASLLTEDRAETFGRWSKRWMEAERDLAPDEAAAVAAVRAHRDRMRNLETGGVLKRWLEDRIKPTPTDESYLETMKTVPTFTDTLRFFRLEADSWLAKSSAPR